VIERATCNFSRGVCAIILIGRGSQSLALLVAKKVSGGLEFGMKPKHFVVRGKCKQMVVGLFALLMSKTVQSMTFEDGFTILRDKMMNELIHNKEIMASIKYEQLERLTVLIPQWNFPSLEFLEDLAAFFGLRGEESDVKDFNRLTSKYVNKILDQKVKTVSEKILFGENEEMWYYFVVHVYCR